MLTRLTSPALRFALSQPIRTQPTKTLAIRTLTTSSKRQASYWRPRWENESWGQYWGGEWFRRQLVIETEFTWTLIIFLPCMFWLLNKIYSDPKEEARKYHFRFHDKYHDNHFDHHHAYPRPIRVSELTNPDNKWYRYANVMGEVNTTVPAYWEVGSGRTHNCVNWAALRYDLTDIPGLSCYATRTKVKDYDMKGTEVY